MPRFPSHRAIVALAVALSFGCNERPRFDLGDECELTTECAAPLVCRLGRCREECRDNRDCRIGLVCLRDPAALGACELADEGCTLNSECPEPLVCRMERCRNACVADVDCPPGSFCVLDDAGTGACHDRAETECEYNSQCESPYICAPDGRCREQCHADRDCRDGTRCDFTSEPWTCRRPEDIPDPGPGDGGTLPDGGTQPDGGTPDGGTLPDSGMALAPAPTPALAAGFEHTCAIRRGTLYCWGENLSGQIGDGSFTERHVPAALGIAAPTMVVTGAEHACALGASGISCWGRNDLGQVGDGTTTSPRPSAASTGIASATWLAAGRDHTCALVAGEVRCWGDNTLGQLGDGTTTMRRTPTPTVALGGTPVEIAARARHTCARLATGTIQCWGENAYGQLGNGTSTAMGVATPTPVDVLELTDAVEVIAGSTHTCARTAVGAVYCWGSNAFYQLGDGTTTPRNRPGSPIAGLPPIAELAGGLDHVCARAVDGRVYCWGGNAYGQGGLDPLSSFSAMEIRTPRQIPSIAGATELAAGDFHTCARIGADVVQCWGYNNSGQLGDNGTSDSFDPRTVLFP